MRMRGALKKRSTARLHARPAVHLDQRGDVIVLPSVHLDQCAVHLDQRGDVIVLPSVHLDQCAEVIDPCAELIDPCGDSGSRPPSSIVRDARASFLDFLTVGVDGA